jgi:16S rRNA (cytosine967-C5)-methyltransferase
VERWRTRYGFEAAEAWCQFDNEPAPLSLRANRLRIARDDLGQALRQEGVDTEPAPYAPDGLIVTRGNPLLSPLASQGLFVVQDEASQIVGEVAAARPGERILDACAAPGGKTLAMAAAMGNAGILRGRRRPRQTGPAPRGHRRRSRRRLRACRTGQCRAGAALCRHLRLCPCRRSVHGSRDAAARSRHQVAPRPGRLRRGHCAAAPAS